MRIYTIAALLPAFLLLKYIYKQDEIEKEPPELLARLLLLGGGGSVLASLALESVLGDVLNRLLNPLFDYYAYHFLLAFVCVACVEEGSKWFFLKRISWNSPHFDFLFDAVVYSAFVSLGFAAIENLKYVFSYGLATALARAITAVPAHLCFSILMGVFYGRARNCFIHGDSVGERKNQWLAFLIPTLVHGFYDFCLMLDSTAASWVFLIFTVLMFLLVYRLLHAAARSDRPIYESSSDRC